MPNRMPSLLALLGLAAAAGYQNRNSIKSMLDKAIADRVPASRGATNGHALPPQSPDAPDGALPRRTEAGLVSTLQAGLAELVQRFGQSGNADIADSWVGKGQNKFVTPDQLRPVLGDEVLAELAGKTGLTESDLLARLAQVLPEAVDQLTPDGVVPVVDSEAERNALPHRSPLGQY